jgi:hypothetical protein
MGNTNCVSCGGCPLYCHKAVDDTPHRADIVIANDSKYELQLDTSVKYGRDVCNHGHGGWTVLNGNIVDGHEPPQVIKAYENGKFSVSGRDSKGEVFYINKTQDCVLEVIK